jgi:NAD(P)H-hydrate epimerase
VSRTPDLNRLSPAQRLQRQCENMKIPVLAPSSETGPLKAALTESDVVLDAIFGFSFKGPVRPPFDDALRLISESKLGIVSVDQPSGWEVDGGRSGGIALEPDVLISLTAPKEGVRDFKGRHFLGGRFVTKSVLTLCCDVWSTHARATERWRRSLS